MRKQEEPYLNGNLTAMIDVVFQLIIFFIATVTMQKKSIDDSIQLTMSPNGAAVHTQDPRTINIDVHQNGDISIAQNRVSQELLKTVLKKVVADQGSPDNVPVVIRGDGRVAHDHIKKALDACTDAGIIKVKFAAMKEKNS
jgi:biopolymer transport protein ExbD